MHPFELKGLGKAPFRLTGYEERTWHGKPGATCDYCHTCIKHCFMIVSGDGQESKVGSDCINKAMDADLKVSAKKIRAAALSEQRHARWLERHQAKLEAERNRNGGLTDYELAIVTAKAKADEERRYWTARNQWLLSVLNRQSGNFAAGMIYTLERGPISGLPDKAVCILRDIYAKASGRRNSAAYSLAELDFDANAGE